MGGRTLEEELESMLPRCVRLVGWGELSWGTDRVHPDLPHCSLRGRGWTGGGWDSSWMILTCTLITEPYGCLISYG